MLLTEETHGQRDIIDYVNAVVAIAICRAARLPSDFCATSVRPCDFLSSNGSRTVAHKSRGGRVAVVTAALLCFVVQDRLERCSCAVNQCGAVRVYRDVAS